MSLDSGTRKRLEAAVLAGMDSAGRDVMQWGKDDCALWCANIVRDTLAYDPAADFRGRYKSRRGAVRALGATGLKGALQRAARRHKWKRINPAMAQPGDVGMAWTEYEGKAVLATVICRSTGWFVGRNEKGWTAALSSDVVVAWAVLPDHGPGAHVSPRVNWRRDIAPKDPISGIIALITAITSTSIGTFLLTTALSIGISLVASLFQPHKGIGLDDNLADTSQVASVQVTERQPIPFKRVIVGRAYVGGALFFEQVKPPYLTLGVLLNYGQISGVDKLFIGTNEIRFSGGIVDNTILTPQDIDGQSDYPNKMRVCYRFGATDQALDPLIAARYSNISTDFRQRGIATYVGEYNFGGSQDGFLALWGQVSRPNAYHVVRGVVAYDPRDPTQILDDETTWQWTRNASLIQAWYLTRDFGGRIPKSTIRWDKIADAANYDDEVIGCSDGTLIPRHTIDGVITLNQKPFEVMQKLLTANGGLLLESAGQVWVSSSRPRTPVATIHDGILTGAFKYQAAKAKRDLVNKLQVRAVAPGMDYQLVDGPIRSDTDLQTADGEVLPATLALEYTLDESPNWTRVQRLQKLFLARARLGRTIQCTVDLDLLAKASDELVGNVVTVDSQLFGIANGTYMVTSVGLADDMASVALALTEYDSSIESDWNPEVDEQPFELAEIDVS